MASAGLNSGLESARPTRSLWARILLPAALLALAGILLFVTSLPPTCPMRVVLGVPCPSCGLTRATRLAFGGDLAGATHMHPLWFVVLPYVAWIAGVQIASFVRTGELASMERSVLVTRGGQAIAALLVVVWIARFLGAFGGPCPV